MSFLVRSRTARRVLNAADFQVQHFAGSNGLKLWLDSAGNNHKLILTADQVGLLATFHLTRTGDELFNASVNTVEHNLCATTIVETTAFLSQGHLACNTSGTPVTLTVDTPGSSPKSADQHWSKPAYTAHIPHEAAPITMDDSSVPKPLPLCVSLSNPPASYRPAGCTSHCSHKTAHALSVAASLLREFWPRSLGRAPVDVQRLVETREYNDVSTIIPSTHASPLASWVVRMLILYQGAVIHA